LLLLLLLAVMGLCCRGHVGVIVQHVLHVSTVTLGLLIHMHVIVWLLCIMCNRDTCLNRSPTALLARPLLLWAT
jgi:hypothetical protein